VHFSSVLDQVLVVLLSWNKMKFSQFLNYVVGFDQRLTQN